MCTFTAIAVCRFTSAQPSTDGRSGVSVSHKPEGHLHEIHGHVTRTLSGHGGHVRKDGKGIVLYSSNNVISYSRISSGRKLDFLEVVCKKKKKTMNPSLNIPFL